MADELLLWFIAACFFAVSVSITVRMLFEVYIEYVQLREGIIFMRNMKEQMEEEQDDDTHY